MKRGYSVRVYGRARTKKNGRKYKDWYVIISLNGKEIEHIKAEPNTEAAAKELKFRRWGNFISATMSPPRTICCSRRWLIGICNIS